MGFRLISINSLILKVRLVNCLNISQLLKQLLKVCVRQCSQENLFMKVILKAHLVVLFLLKFQAFTFFFFNITGIIYYINFYCISTLNKTPKKKNHYRWMRLKYDHYPLRSILFQTLKSDSGSCLKLQQFHWKKFQ